MKSLYESLKASYIIGPNPLNSYIILLMWVSLFNMGLLTESYTLAYIYRIRATVSNMSFYTLINSLINLKTAGTSLVSFVFWHSS